jgi:hypothetical protein
MMDVLLWKSNINLSLQELADINLQRQLWLGKNPGKISSPDELYNGLFDDDLFDEFLEVENNGLNKAQLELAKTLSSRLKAYSPGDSALPDAEIMLEDLEWIKITHIAAELLTLLEDDNVK